jgi:hypothetical protein
MYTYLCTHTCYYYTHECIPCIFVEINGVGYSLQTRILTRFERKTSPYHRIWMWFKRSREPFSSAILLRIYVCVYIYICIYIYIIYTETSPYHRIWVWFKRSREPFSSVILLRMCVHVYVRVCICGRIYTYIHTYCGSSSGGFALPPSSCCAYACVCVCIECVCTYIFTRAYVFFLDPFVIRAWVYMCMYVCVAQPLVTHTYTYMCMLS